MPPFSPGTAAARQFDRRERDDRTLLAVLEHGEVIRAQAADRVPILVEHGRLDPDDVGGRSEDGGWLLPGRGPRAAC